MTRNPLHGSPPLSVLDLLETDDEAAQFRELLRDVIDPELGIDIVSLGLVYGLDVHGRVAAVTLTTTTPACPLGEYLSEETETVLLDSGGVDEVLIAFTHSPPWTPDMMSDDAKRQLGWF